MIFRFSVVYFLLFANFAVITPYLQVFLHLRHYDAQFIGLLLGLFELAGVAGPLALGYLADRRGLYRPLLILSLLMSLLLFVLLRFIPVPLGALILVSLFGLLYKPIIPLTDAITTRNLEDPGRDYGRARVFGSVGFVVVSLVIQFSGVLATPSTTAILGAHLVTGAAFLGSLLLLPSRKGERRAVGTRLEPPATGSIDPRFWIGILIVFTARFAITAHYSFFSLFLQERMGVTGISGIWAIGPTAEMPVILFGGLIVRRIGMEGLFALSLLAVSTRLFCYSLVPPLPVLMLVQLLHALTFGGLHMAAVSLVNRFTSPSRRAMGMAIYVAVGMGVSAFIASALAGVVVARAGFAVMFRLYSIIPLAGLLLLPLMRRRWGGRTSARES